MKKADNTKKVQEKRKGFTKKNLYHNCIERSMKFFRRCIRKVPAINPAHFLDSGNGWGTHRTAP